MQYELPEGVFSGLIYEAMNLAGMETNIPFALFNLTAGDKRPGIIGVWGRDLSQDDLPVLSIFANQMAWAIERINLYNNEKIRSAELERTNQLITALVNVTSLMGSSTDSTNSMEVLGNELENLGLQCMVGTLNNTKDIVTINYSNFASKISKFVSIIGPSLIGYQVPKKLWPGTEVVTESQPVWFDNPIKEFNRIFPHVPENLFAQVLNHIGITAKESVCILPLISDGEVIGVFPIWGKGIGETDTPTLMIFAHQVAENLRNTINYEYELQRANTLAHSNAIIIALSNVAARLETTASMDEVFDTIGNELKKVDVNCFIGTLDKEKQFVTLKYYTMRQEIKKMLVKFGIKLPSETIIPRKLWPSNRAVDDGIPYWDPMPIGSTSKMFPFIPKPLFAQAFRRVGLDPEDRVCYLPLIIDERVIGILAVWGPNLHADDLPGLSIFANQVATAIERINLHTNEIKRSEELERANQLITALVNVSTLMGPSTDSTNALEVLGSELEKLKLHCVVGTVNSKKDMVTFNYSSFTTKISKYLTKVPNFDFIGYQLPKKFWPGTKVIIEGQPVWYSDPIKIFKRMFPHISEDLVTQTLKHIGITAKDSLCILPLINEGEVIGVLPIWGTGIQISDTPTLIVFAHQVAENLRNTMNYENELRRANSLAHSNSIIVALSNVATRLQTASNIETVYETLGSELKKVNINSMIGILEDEQQSMHLEYLSVFQDIKGQASKLGIKWPEKMSIPRKLWPTEKVVIDKSRIGTRSQLAALAKCFHSSPAAFS